MIIGVPKEIKPQEYRVALVPGAVAPLVNDGHRVIIERGAGLGSGFSDHDYLAGGASIVETHEDVFAEADLIVKVKEPIASEYGLLRQGQIIFTYLHLAAEKPLTEALIASGCTAIAYETVVKNGRLPLLEPMSEIAGRMSSMVGALELSKNNSGMGKLLGGIPGVLPAKVTVIGGGTAGVNAARIAAGLGADVTILEMDVDRMRFLDATLPKNIKTLFSNIANLTTLLPDTDLLIGAVLVPGAKAPKLITREMLGSMKQGSVLVDIAIDQGGCAETSRPTTHQNPTYVIDGITHYCVANMPGAFAQTATQGLTNVTFGYLRKIANLGVIKAAQDDQGLLPGINVMNGKLHCSAVASALDLPYTPLTLN
ncbi:MAG: alanine dehydrogenase [Verrucomicrobia bacterium]|nr:MAG: alanine dehydrogenase [Verrucomicrobiota bacterium]